MISSNYCQTSVFATFIGVALALQFTVNPGLTQQLLLLVPLVAILGLPHGALDLPIAEALWPLSGWRRKLRFVIIYLGLVAAMILAWVLVPGIALIAFLSYSMLHFSDDWSNAVPPLRVTGGIATIGAPALFHREEVTVLFSYLAPPNFALFSANAAAILGIAGLVMFIFTLVFKPEARGQAAFEQPLLWSAAFALPPLLYFTVYFCGLHSLRHFSTAIASVPHTRNALAVAALLSAFVCLAAIIFIVGQNGAALNVLPKTAMQAVFIGLAALTVPHMLLVDRFNRERQTDNRL